MERITTPPATIDQQELGIIEKEARQRALDKAAESGKRVTEIGRIEKEEFRAVLEDHKQGAEAGAEGAGVTQPPEATEGAAQRPAEAKPKGDIMTPQQAEMELEARAKKADAKRVAQIAPTPDAVVVKPDGDMLAQQDDSNRQVGITARGLSDDAVESGLTKRAALHEGDHQKQEIGDQKMELPPTGNPTIDGYRAGFRRLTFREDRSIHAEGGLAGHTAEYHGYVKYADAVRGELNAAGENGDAMVRDAGYTVKGFQDVHAALARAAILKQVKQGNLSAAAQAAKDAEVQHALAA